MAINRPTTKTIISTSNWGIPITDEVNRLTTQSNTNTTDITNLKPTAWTNASLANGWTNWGGNVQVLQYRKVGDIVYIRGGLKSPGPSGATVITTLPAGFRCSFQLEFPCTYYSGSRLVCGVTANGDGTLIAADIVPVNALLSLTVVQYSTLP